MRLPRRGILHLAASAVTGAATLPLLPKLAAAQAWPNRLIKAIVPLTPGAASDIMARIVMEQISTQLGQPTIVVEVEVEADSHNAAEPAEATDARRCGQVGHDLLNGPSPAQ